MLSESIKVLDEKHEELKDLNSPYERVIEELTFIESFIPDFFSKNGEAEGIKKMYKDIHTMKENPYKESNIESYDFSFGNHIYQEYIEGMSDFIRDIAGIDDDTKLNDFSVKFETAKSKDYDFINSLFGGNLNKSKEIDITEASENIEFLIDFIPELKTFREHCEDFNTLYTNEGLNDKEKLLKSTLNLLFESVSEYCYLTTKNVLEAYSSIKTFLESGSQDTNTEKNKFKLFL